jgi:hypothetical protein
MNELNNFLAEWKQGDYINPDGLEAAYNAMIVLVAKVESLEQQVATLQSLQEGN